MRLSLWRSLPALCATAVCAGVALATPTAANAQVQVESQYRGFWVDTFNTTLNNHTDVLAVVNNAKAAKANALFVQVRRRGDSWYLNTLEPLADRVPLTPGFDPLLDIINTGHAAGLEIHAYVIVNAVYGRDPQTLLPANPSHVFTQHGGYNTTTKTVVPGPNNWLTRTLLPDQGTAITYQGHRIGNDFWIDPGHPAAEAYTVDVLMHLVKNYNVDGLHLDRIRYPELSVTGQTATTGANIGYNPKNVSRFNNRYGITPNTTNPAQNNTLWTQWRRDQVSNLVRRIYLNAIAVKPQLKISASLITFGSIGTNFNTTEPYWRVYQDWRAWTEEGILDMAIPMDYKQEHLPTIVPQFDQWLEWTRNHQYDRSAIIGIGGSVNAIEGTLRQTRRALQPSASTGNIAAGVTFFSMATSNIAVTANPWSIPAGQNTPARSFAEFASALKTGNSVNGLVQYEPLQTPVFSLDAVIPPMPWKTSPQVGHIMGFAKDILNVAADTAAVRIERIDGPPVTSGRTLINTATDGGGFYGGVDLAPGTYRVTVTPVGQAGGATDCVEVFAGQVSTLNIRTDQVDPIAPATTADVSPTPNADGWANQNVTVTLTATDNPGGSGIATIHYSATGAQPLAETSEPGSSVTLNISTEGSTTITFSAEDEACNHEASKTVTIKLDKSAPQVTGPADITVGNDPGQAYATVDPGTASATDAVSSVASITGVRSDGKPLTDPYPVGVTTITWTATDAAGNTADASQTITVNDVEAPVISGASVDKPTVEQNNHKMTDVVVSYTVKDNVDPEPLIVTSLSVESNEPENGLGDGDTGPDWEIVDAHHVRLRAERSGTGDGRIYTITITAVDSKGNRSSTTVTVTVPH
jgi:uncharacterized lipoprotein YddW (UPF0748 family)